MVADAGIPILFVQWPLMLWALLPVVLVEVLLIRVWVPLSRKQSFAGLFVANLASTLAGIPLAWTMMLAIEAATLWLAGTAADHWHWHPSSPVFDALFFLACFAWLNPGAPDWVVCAAIALLLIPSFYLSVWIERSICLGMWRSSDKEQVRKGVLRANLASYGTLFLIGCIWTIRTYWKQR